jgi:hypothetical protein
MSVSTCKIKPWLLIIKKMKGKGPRMLKEQLDLGLKPISGQLAGQIGGELKYRLIKCR